MTLSELRTQLLTLGMPAEYGGFSTPPEPPYIVYVYAYSNDVMADNQNYVDIGNFQVELYTVKKDPASEGLVETLLKSLRLPYLKVEAFIDSLKLRQVVYQIQLIGG
jgi:hypothetical protein